MNRTSLRLCLALGLGLVVACSSATETSEPSSITPPLCNQVAHFGNGATCSAAAPTLPECGSAAKRTCATGWLCFDAPEFANCGCAKDNDCEGRAAYINAARTLAKKAPLSASCVQGRCAGQP